MKRNLLICSLVTIVFSASSHAALSRSASHRIFVRLNQNADAFLDVREFARIMGETTPAFTGYSMRTYREFFRADADQSNGITNEEFFRWNRRQTEELAGESIERFFRADHSKDQLLDAAELRFAYKGILSKRNIATEIKRLDMNDDGKLSLREFFRFLPMDCKTLLGMKISDANLLMSAFELSYFVWRNDDVAYPYDPVFGEPQPLLFLGLNGGVITDCSMRFTIQPLE